MAHYAFLNNNNIVTDVITGVDESDTSTLPSEFSSWEEFYETKRGQTCKRTSYNTLGNQHNLDGTPFRGNFAAIGYTWDEVNEIFWPKQPHPSFTKDIATATWKAPIEKPSITSYTVDGVTKSYSIYWDENLHQTNSTKGWKAIDREIPSNIHTWTDGSWVAD